MTLSPNDNKNPKVGGTPMGAKNKVGTSGEEPPVGKKSMSAVSMASSSGGSAKPVGNASMTAVGGTSMGK